MEPTTHVAGRGRTACSDLSPRSAVAAAVDGTTFVQACPVAPGEVVRARHLDLLTVVLARTARVSLEEQAPTVQVIVSLRPRVALVAAAVGRVPPVLKAVQPEVVMEVMARRLSGLLPRSARRWGRSVRSTLARSTSPEAVALGPSLWWTQETGAWEVEQMVITEMAPLPLLPKTTRVVAGPETKASPAPVVMAEAESSCFGMH